MRPLRYSINVSVDGCCDHRAMVGTETVHRHAVENLTRADALLFGRVTYELMEVWREPVPAGARPAWMEPFAEVINAARKYVVSNTLESLDWNAEVVRGDELEETVARLKAEPGEGLLTGGVTLPLALAGMGLIDEYEFVVQPLLVGHGPNVFAGLSEHVDLELLEHREIGAGLVVLRYAPKR